VKNNDILRLPSLAVDQVEEDEHGYYITAAAVNRMASCPECGRKSLKKNGTRPQLFNDCPIHGKQVILNIVRGRYLCKACGKTSHEEIADLSKSRRMTKRLVSYVQKKAISHTFADVASETGINEKTVRNIFNDYVPLLEKQHKPETPRWMGIDEIHIIRKPRGIITNVEQRTVVDVLPNRNKALIKTYFKNMKHRHRIRYVAMDMWPPYRDAVRDMLPQATVIVDKFHVVRMANLAMEKVRKALREKLTPSQRRALKHDKKVLRKRLHDLTDEEYLLFSGWVRNYPELAQAHVLKEGFFALWDSPTRSAAEQAYEKWKADVPQELMPYFHPILRAMGNWHHEIFNYFDHRITNAYTESLNNLIRVMHRMGRGYSFEALRTRILFSEGIQKTRVKTSARARRRADESTHCFESTLFTIEEEKIFNYGADIEKLIQLIKETNS